MLTNKRLLIYKDFFKRNPIGTHIEDSDKIIYRLTTTSSDKLIIYKNKSKDTVKIPLPNPELYRDKLVTILKKNFLENFEIRVEE